MRIFKKIDLVSQPIYQSKMVKNIMGGGKSRKGARNRDVDSVTRKKIRYAKQDGEVYASVTRLLGGANCEVKCVDRMTRLCVIRSKFRGRGKRDNTLTSGTWVMVGLRDWETPPAGKLPKCDLLEVYSATDKQDLKNTDTDVDWSALAGIGTDHEVVYDEEVEFVEQGGSYSDETQSKNQPQLLGDSNSYDTLDVDAI